MSATDARFQLRSYRVDPDHLDDFLHTWATAVVPLREKYGLHTLEAWLSVEGSRFTWVSYVDESADYASVEAAYVDSDDRRSLTPDPASWLLESDVHFVRPVHRPAAG